MAKRNRKSSAQKSRVNLLEFLEPRQLLSTTSTGGNAALAISSSLMVFNAVRNSAASQIETVTLTDTGGAAISLGSIAIANDPTTTAAASQFAIVNTASEPATLNPGQSFGLQLQYTANTVGTQAAVLNIASSDPVNPAQTVELHGVGTAGLGGSNQPSLATILQAYDIPTYVGEGYDDANAASDSVYPQVPDASSQEVTMPRLEKAGTGPVTISVLASFTGSGTEPYTLGTYVPGEPSVRSELFFTPTNESQSTYVQPEGSSSFDPGTSQFGFYFVSNLQTNGADRIGYSEDSLNTWDTTVDRKFRFFPDETATGAIIPNTYVMTSTDYNAPAGYDFTNIVAIISNVQPAPSAPVLGLTNGNGTSTPDRLVFSKINAVDPNHPTYINNTQTSTTLTVNNTGNQPLVISSYAMSGPFTLVNAPTFPMTLAAGQSLTLTVGYNAQTQPSVPYNETDTTSYPTSGGVWNGTLVLNSNDPVNPARTIALAGWRQYHPENDNEPSLQTLVNLELGDQTVINSTPIPDLLESGSVPVYYGSEVVSNYWAPADTSRPVNVQTFAAWHSQNTSQAILWYSQGSNSTHLLYTVNTTNAQTLYPDIVGSTTTQAQGSFSTSSAFGLEMDGLYTDDTKNYRANTGGDGHVARFFPLVNSQGQDVPNSFIVAWDYNDVGGQNYDFQDNVMVVTNIRPAAVPPTPTDVTVYNTSTGNLIQWAPASYTNLGGYLVFSATSPTGPFTQLTSSPITTTNYTDALAPATGSVYYQVTAIDATSNAQSTAATTAELFAGTTGPKTAAGDPVAATETARVLAGNSVSVPVQADSTDANAVLSPTTITVTTKPSHGTVAISTQLGTITYTPNAGYTGTDTFKYDIGDTTGAISSPATVTLTISPVIVGEPSVGNLSASTTTTAPVTVQTMPTASDSTATLIPSTLQIVTAPADGTVSINLGNGAITYTANSGFSGTDTFTYTIADSLSAVSNLGLVTVTVAAAPVIPIVPAVGHPVATAVSLTTSSATAATVSLLTNATDSTGTINASSVSITTAPAHGTATVNASGNLTYTPTAGFVGTDTLQYTVGDSLGATSAPATVTMDVGQMIGGSAARTVTFVDANGTRTVVSLTGLGSGQIFFNGNATAFYVGSPSKGNVMLTGTGLTMDDIVISGTTTASTLSITGKGSASIPVGSISDTTAIRAINAPNAVVTGGIAVGGSVTSVTVRQTGGTFTVGGSAAVLSFGSVSSNWIGVVAGSVSSLTVRAGGFNGSFTAASLGTGKVVGGITNSTLKFTAGGVARLAVTGAISGTTITANGNIGAISSAGITNSSIEAGVVATGLPATASQFVSGYTIGSVTVTGRGSVFSNSVIAAQTIKGLSLGTVTTANNGAAFGVAAGTIGSVSAAFSSGGSLRAGKKQLDTQTDFTAYLSSRDLAPIDFAILVGL